MKELDLDDFWRIDMEELANKFADLLSFVGIDVIDCRFNNGAKEAFEISYGEFGKVTSKTIIPVNDIKEDYFGIVKRVIKEVDRFEMYGFTINNFINKAKRGE